MGSLSLLVFFLAMTSGSLAAPAGDDAADGQANLADLFGIMGAASGGDAQAGQPNLGALFGNMAAAQPGGDAPAGQASLGDLFGMMGGMMAAMAPEEEAKEIQQQMGQVSQMFGGMGLAPAGPDTADVALDLNAGAEEPIAAQQQGPYRLEVKDRHSGFPLATEEQVNEHLSTVLDDMNKFCGHWCIARIDGARVHGFGHGAKVSPIDPTHEEEHEIVAIPNTKDTVEE